MECPKASTTRAGIGRVVWLFAPGYWAGPQAAVVTGGAPVSKTPAGGPGEDEGRVAVNALVDAIKHPDVLRKFRERREGNTFGPVQVFDPLSGPQREHLAAREAAWAEWPPRG